MTEQQGEHFKNGSPVPPPALATQRRINAERAKKPTTCKVCSHPERGRIEALHVGGVSLERLAEQFGVHKDAIWRHCQKHLTDEAKISYLAGPAAIADLANRAADENRSLIDYLSITRSILFRQLVRAAEDSNAHQAERVAGRLLETLNAIGKITGEITALASTQINIQNN